MNKRTLRNCAGAFAISILVLPLVAFLILAGLWGAGRFLIISEPPLSQVDVVAVLSGGEIDRIDEAVQLIQKGYARYLILTDTDTMADSGRRMTDYLFSEAANRGLAVPQIDITRHTASNTREEAAAIRQLMEERGWRSCIVVTDPYHSRRAQIIFSNVFRDSGLSVQVHSVRGHWYTVRGWFLHREGWKAMFQEYLRIFATLLGLDK